MHVHLQVETIVTAVSDSLFLAGIMSATGNGYVIYMTIKRKTKLKPPELMTLNLAIFDFGISGTGLNMQLPTWFVDEILLHTSRLKLFCIL